MKGCIVPEERRERIRKSNIEYWSNPEVLKNHSILLKEKKKEKLLIKS